VEDAISSAYYPKILGTYEKELHQTIKILTHYGPGECWIIGAAEGYYAVGMSKLLNVPVKAWETDDLGQKMIRKLANNNQIKDEIIQIKGKCNPGDLMRFDRSERRLIIMDIEGEEEDMFQKNVMRNFSNSCWLIEVHRKAFIEEAINSLSSIYKIDFIPVSQRGLEDLPMRIDPVRKWLFGRYYRSLVQEWRTSDSFGWLVMIPKSW
jgi:hypothetical protein